MKKPRTAAIALLILAGSVMTVYSYGGLHAQEVLFNRGDTKPGANDYVSVPIDVSLAGKTGVKVTGYVGSTACCVEFYLVNYTEWSAWIANPALRPGLAMLHVSSAVVKSQSAAGQFSFVPPASSVYNVVFVNDDYPNATSATVHANVILLYVSLDSVYAMAAGLALVALGIGLLGLELRARNALPNY